MKITKLHITNFVQVASVHLDDLTGTTILTGENGVGKTTILNALTFAFGFPVRDARGVTISNKDLIGPNGDTCEVKALMEIGDRNLKLTATVGKERSVEIIDIERKQPAFLAAKGITATYTALYEAIGVPAQHIECAMSPRAYMLGPDLGAILADLCAGEWDMNDLQDAAGEHWIYLNTKIVGKTKPDLDALGKLAFTTRTEIKKSLASTKDELGRLDAVECPTSRDGKPMAESHIPVIEDALKGFHAQRDALMAEKGAVGSETGDRRAELEAAQAKVLADLEVAETFRNKAEFEYKQTQETLQSASKALTGVKEEHSKRNAVYLQAKALHEARLESGTQCSLCGHAMTEDEKIAVIEDAAHESYKAKTALDEIDLNDAKRQFDEFERTNNEAREASHKATAEYDRLITERNRIEHELEKLGKAKKQRSIDAIQTELESVEERIETGKQKLDMLRQWVAKQKYEAQADSLAKEIEHLNWMVAAFRDGEFLKSRLSGKVNVFEDACNEKLAPFGYSLAVRVEGKNAEVWLQKGDLTPAPIARCSKAELVLTGYAIATAFGVNSPVCIDDMDAMFSETKSKFIAQLKQRINDAPLFASGAWTAGAVDLEPISKYLTNAKVVWIGKEKAS
jgi:hypothetical protein